MTNYRSYHGCSDDIASNIAKMYPLLVGTSKVTMGTALTLAISDTNKKSGHHYLELSEYKFKLEWEISEPAKPSQGASIATPQDDYYYQQARMYNKVKEQQCYNLKLYSVVNEAHPALPNPWNCDVKVRISMYDSLQTLPIVRGRALKSKARQGIKSATPESLQLIGTAKCTSMNVDKNLEISFVTASCR